MAIIDAARARSRRVALIGGGTDGNEQLTAMVGIVLIVLLAVIGLTIVQIRQLIWVHLFVGLLLLGPVAIKMGSTGYRFARYYTRERAYRDKGPPELVMRAIAPGVVLTTVIVFVSGLVLLFDGPRSRDQWLPIHKVSFIVWAVLTGLHVLGHLPGLGRSLHKAEVGFDNGSHAPGQAGRWIALAGATVGGLVLALVLISHFGSWTAAGAFPHHHEH